MIDQGTCLPLLVWDQYSRVGKWREGGGKSWRWQDGGYRPVTAHTARRSSHRAVDRRFHSVQDALLRLLGAGRKSRKNRRCRLSRKCPKEPVEILQSGQSPTPDNNQTNGRGAGHPVRLATRLNTSLPPRNRCSASQGRQHRRVRVRTNTGATGASPSPHANRPGSEDSAGSTRRRRRAPAPQRSLRTW